MFIIYCNDSIKCPPSYIQIPHSQRFLKSYLRIINCSDKYILQSNITAQFRAYLSRFRDANETR